MRLIEFELKINHAVRRENDGRPPHVSVHCLPYTTIVNEFKSYLLLFFFRPVLTDALKKYQCFFFSLGFFYIVYIYMYCIQVHLDRSEGSEIRLREIIQYVYTVIR